MEFEFVENFYDTIKSRARVAALRKNTNVLEVDENKKKRKTIRRNNLKSKAKNSLKGKAKVRRRKASKDTELTPAKRRANSNKKTPSPSKKKLVPATNNEIDDEEAALILCNLSTISQRSFDSFYTRFPSTADNKIEIPILSTAESFNHVVAYSDQPYSHILLDHNYWSATNQPEIKFELKVEHSNSIPVAAPSTDDVLSFDDRTELEKSIENEVRVEVKQEVDTIVNKLDVVDEKQQQQQPEVNNNLLAESLLSIVKHEEKEEVETTAATAAKALTTTKVKQKKVVKKKEKCRRILSTNINSSGKKKTQNKTIKKRKEKQVSLSNGFALQPVKKQRSKSHEKVDDDVKKCESPLEELQQQNHDKTAAIVTAADADVKLETVQNGSAEEVNGNVVPNGHATDDATHRPRLNSSKSCDDELDDDDDDDDDVADEKSWTLICDFHGTILDKLTSNNVRFCGDMLSESRSTATMSSSSSSSSMSGGVKIVGSMNNYQTSSDSRCYDSNDYYASQRSDSSRYDPVTNCEYRRPSYANNRSQDPRTNNYPYNSFNNRHRKEHFHRHHSYSEGVINNQQTYASYKAQKTFEQRQMPFMIDSGNLMKQSVSVFELPVNGASSIVKDLLPIIERKELLRSKSVADPRLAPASISDSDKYQNPKKKLSLDQYRKRLSSSNISEDFSRDQSSNQTQTT